MSEEKRSKEENEISQLGNVDKIRDVLFGLESKEIKDRFEQIESSINSIREDMQNKIEQIENYLNEKINDEIDTVTKRINNITTQQQSEFTDAREDSLKLEKRLQHSIKIVEDELIVKSEQLQKQQIEIKNTEDELNAKSERLQKQLIEMNEFLTSQINTLKSELLNTISKKISHLNDVKFSRGDIANFFMEAAMSMEDNTIDKPDPIKNIKHKH